MAQNGLLDFLQGASNAAASNVSAPVDGIAWLLRKAGIPVPDAPIGGSDWMAQRGLTAQPQNQLAGLLGESVGGVAPIVAAAKAPQIAKGLLQVEANAAAPRTLRPEAGAIVYHGSPHKFDRFDASKIGTGEGAQAYGHGLYLAESPGVAQSYQRNLAATLSMDGKPVFQNGRIVNSTGNETVDDLLLMHSGDTKAAGRDILTQLRELRSRFATEPKATAPAMIGVEDKIIKQVQSELAALRGVRNQSKYSVDGSLYKVDLPDNKIAQMLDWDKPLSQQAPGVQAAANARLAELRALGGSPPKDPSGEWLHRAFQPQAGEQGFGQSLAADRLRQAGIPGIRYLDGGSRGTGAGTSNFVVFPGEENALRILERNGGLLAP